MFNTIAMIGLGYIGLPTATLFASRKQKVIGIDVSQHIVDTINQGKIHIVEPELGLLVQAAVASGYLRATTRPEPAEAFLIAVPTPFTDGRKPDLRFIEAAAMTIAPVLAKGNLVILESTSPVGTTAKLADWLAEARPDLSFPQQKQEAADIQIAYCPERVLPGRVVSVWRNTSFPTPADPGSSPSTSIERGDAHHGITKTHARAMAKIGIELAG
jgi:UDP-N-acetyl-D-mannosaminuronic acid dehydrogenase